MNITHNISCRGDLHHSIGKVLQVRWGNIIGDISKQEDLIAYIANILLEYPTLEEFEKAKEQLAEVIITADDNAQAILRNADAITDLRNVTAIHTDDIDFCNQSILKNRWDINQLQSLTTEQGLEIENKVDKVDGYGLSKNDLSDVLKALYDDAVVKAHIHENKAFLDSLTSLKTINGESLIGDGNIEVSGCNGYNFGIDLKNDKVILRITQEEVERLINNNIKSFLANYIPNTIVTAGIYDKKYIGVIYEYIGNFKTNNAFYCDLYYDAESNTYVGKYSARKDMQFATVPWLDTHFNEMFVKPTGLKTINDLSLVGSGNIEVKGVTDYNELENRPFEVIDDAGITSLKVINADKPNTTDGKAGIAALGYDNVANGYGTLVGGSNNYALGARSFAMGRYNNANGNSSTALGYYAAALKSYDFAIGGYIYESVTLSGSNKTYTLTFTKATAENDYWCVVGNIIVGTRQTIIETVSKVSNAVYNITTRDDLGTLSNSTVKLNLTIASGGKSYAAMGSVASGLNSFAQGWENFAVSDYTTALGLNNRVQGNYSVGIGYRNITINGSNYTVGEDNQVSNNSVALGISNRVKGYNSIACGLGLTTKNSQEVAVGVANRSTQSDNPNEATAFSVGIGNDTEAKNGLEIKKSGKILGQDGKEIAYKDDITPNTPNIIKFGDLDVTDGQMSNFSSSNYAQFPFLVDLTDKMFEITMQITTSADVTTQQNILDSQDGLAFAVRNGQLVLAVSNNGTQWAFEAVGGTIAANTTYLIKLGWNKSVYSVKYSTDNGATWVEAISQNSTLSPYPRTMLIGKDTTDRYIFKGSINLNKCTLAINGQYVWDGMTDAGLLTRLDTSLSNIDANGVDYINNLIDAKIGDIDAALKYILGDE